MQLDRTRPIGRRHERAPFLHRVLSDFSRTNLGGNTEGIRRNHGETPPKTCYCTLYDSVLTYSERKITPKAPFLLPLEGYLRGAVDEQLYRSRFISMRLIFTIDLIREGLVNLWPLPPHCRRAGR